MTPSAASRVLLGYVAGASLLRLADEGARVALVLLALERTGSAGLGGALVAALLIPHALAAPLIGTVIGRVSQPRWLISAAGAVLAAALAASTALLGTAPTALVVVVLLTAGVGGPAVTGGLSAQLGRLLPADRLPRAFGIDSITYNLAGIGGPALVAVLATATSAAVATDALAASACVGAMALTTTALRVHPHPSDPAGGRQPDHQTGRGRAAWTALATDPVLAAVTAASTIGQIGLGALPVVATSLAAAHHRTDAAPWLLSALAAGALTGSLAWTARPAPRRHAPTTVLATLTGLGVMLAAAALTSTITLTMTVFAIAGLFLGPLTGALFTTRHDHSPAPARTQVFTLTAGLKVSATAAGAALAATLTAQPPGTQLLAAAACPLAAALTGALMLRTKSPRPAPARAG